MRRTLGSPSNVHTENAQAALAQSERFQREVVDYEKPGATKRAKAYANTVAKGYDGVCVLALTKAASARDFASLAVAEAAHAARNALHAGTAPTALQQKTSAQLDSTINDLQRLIYRCARSDKDAQFRGRSRTRRR